MEINRHRQYAATAPDLSDLYFTPLSTELFKERITALPADPKLQKETFIQMLKVMAASATFPIPHEPITTTVMQRDWIERSSKHFPKYLKHMVHVMDAVRGQCGGMKLCIAEALQSFFHIEQCMKSFVTKKTSRIRTQKPTKSKAKAKASATPATILNADQRQWMTLYENAPLPLPRFTQSEFELQWVRTMPPPPSRKVQRRDVDEQDAAPRKMPRRARDETSPHRRVDGDEIKIEDTHDAIGIIENRKKGQKRHLAQAEAELGYDSFMDY